MQFASLLLALRVMNVSGLRQDVEPMEMRRGIDGVTGADSVRLVGTRVHNLRIGSTTNARQVIAPVLRGEVGVESSGCNNSLLSGRSRCILLRDDDLWRPGGIGVP